MSHDHSHDHRHDPGSPGGAPSPAGGRPPGHEASHQHHRRTAPASVKVEKIVEGGGESAHAVLSIVIREGRNRQVRNMCDAIGHPVVRLKRVRIGPIADDRIRPGEFRDLTGREIALLKRAARTPEP